MAEKLTKAQHDALKSYAWAADRGCIYWGSPKSSVVLASLGMIEKYCPPSVAERKRMKARPYHITPAGRAALSGEG